MADITINEKDKKKTITLFTASKDTVYTIKKKKYPPVIIKPIDDKKSMMYLKDDNGQLIEVGEISADVTKAEEEINKFFEIEMKYAEAEEKNAEIKALFEKAKALSIDSGAQDLIKLQQKVTEQLKPVHIATEEATKGVIEQLQGQTESLKKVTDQLKDIFADIPKNYFSAVTELFGAVSKAIEEHPVFAIYIEELDKLSQEEQYKGIDFSDTHIEYLDEEHKIEADTPKNKALHEAYRRAVERYEKGQGKQKQAIVKVEKKRSPATVIPVDKINRNVWKGIEETDPNGQINFQFLTGKQGKKYRGIEPLVTYSLDFSSLEESLPIVKKLTSFDKRVMVAVGALFNAGNSTITLTDIYHKMGNAETKRPNSTDLKKINESLTKQLKAHLKIDNYEEERAGLKYPRFKYDSTLLQFERVTAEIDGKITEGAIHFFREPPLLSFAKGRGQITTVKNAVLESPLPKTDKNLKIDDYLIEEISFMKVNKAFSNKILFSTLFEACGLVGDKNPARIKDTIKEYLTHYKKTAFIKNFEIKKDYILITVDTEKK